MIKLNIWIRTLWNLPFRDKIIRIMRLKKEIYKNGSIQAGIYRIYGRK